MIKPSAQLSQSREVLMVWPYQKINEIKKDTEELAIK